MSTLTSSDQQPLQKAASIRNLPVNLFASVMGIAGLSIAWHQASLQFGVSPLIGDGAGVVALIVFVVLSGGYLAKAIRYPEAVIREYHHPVTGNFFGTFAIAVLLLSTVVFPLNPALAEVMWAVGTIFTLGLCFAIASRLMRGKIDTTHAVPAWFIPGVATLDIVVAGGTMPMPWAHEVSLFAMAVGTMIALLFFTMIMSRMIHHEPVPPGMVPSLLILMAPFEVGFLAYTNMTRGIDDFAALLFYFGLFMFLALAPKVFRRGVQFASGWWAIGFPMAALTVAALKYSMFAQAWPITVIAVVLLAMLSIAIIVLFVRTLHWLVNGNLLAG